MRIAIASLDKNEDAEISKVGGRAPYFLIFDDNKLVKVIENPFRFEGGAGWKVVEMLHREGVEMIIAGSIGERMRETMNEKGIKYKEVSGKVKDALKNLA